MIHKLSVQYKGLHGTEASFTLDVKDKSEARVFFEKLLDMTQLLENHYAGHPLAKYAYPSNSDTITSNSIIGILSPWDSISITEPKWEDASAEDTFITIGRDSQS